PRADDVEGVVRPARRVPERAAHRDADGVGAEPDERDVGAERPGHRLGQLLGTRRRRHALERAVDDAEGRVRLEEEVPGDADVAEAVLHDVEVDGDELALGNLVLTTHALQPSRRGARYRGATSRRSSP